MTARSIRRAAERRANKLARKSAQQGLLAAVNQFPTEETQAAETQPETSEPTIVPAAAANAYLSAVTSGLTGQLTLLPAADATQYDQLLREYQNELQPVGLQESNLVQELAESVWRKRRLFALEMTIFAKGRIEFAKQFAEHKPELREALIDVHTFLTYEKQIRGIQLQESRLDRRAVKASAELHALQQERRRQEEQTRRKQEETGQRQREAAAPPNPQAFRPRENGFEFSNREIEPYGDFEHGAEAA